MKILYLDQFIVSNLADSQTEEYKELKNLLKELVDDEKVVCPLSIEHYLESSLRSDEAALRNDELMNYLSGGKCFYTELHITTFLINALLKKQQFTQEMYIGEALKNIFKDKIKIERYRNINQDFRGAREDLLNTLNDFRKITREDKIKNPTKHSLYKVLKRISSISFIERMEDLFRDGQIIIRGDKTPTGEVSNWIDLILEYLLRHFQITPPELIDLYKEVKENGYENIPTLDILSSLNAF